MPACWSNSTYTSTYAGDYPVSIFFMEPLNASTNFISFISLRSILQILGHKNEMLLLLL